MGEGADDLATMQKVVAEANRVVGGITPDQLDQPTPCADWDVRALLNHVTGGSDMFAEGVSQGAISDERVGELLGTDRIGDDYQGAFAAATKRALDAFETPGAAEKMVTLPFGTMPAGVALNIAIFDVAVHAWDLAKATGQSTALDPEVLEPALAVGTAMISDDMRQGGMFGASVPVADDAPTQDRLAAFAGRQP
jgi:uncharacterized protein (TIGR03086 family)